MVTAVVPPAQDVLFHVLLALRADATLTASLGHSFIKYFSAVKASEIARAGNAATAAEVSEWEQREYFEVF